MSGTFAGAFKVSNGTLIFLAYNWRVGMFDSNVLARSESEAFSNAALMLKNVV